MPQIRVGRKRFQRIMQPRCVRKHGDPAEQTVAHKECQKSQPGSPFAEPGINKKNIHGDAAELEWKIPPDITAVSDSESKGKLFPYLAAEHEHTAHKEYYGRNIGEICIFKTGK